MTVTTPTVGRKVWYRPIGFEEAGKIDDMVTDGKQPLDATVVYVHSDRMVNLVIFDAHGHLHRRTSVTLRQPEDPVPFYSYCEWMPYQVKQHEKHQLEDQLKVKIN